MKTEMHSAELVARPIGLVDAPDAKPLAVPHGALRFDKVSQVFFDHVTRTQDC